MVVGSNSCSGINKGMAESSASVTLCKIANNSQHLINENQKVWLCLSFCICRSRRRKRRKRTRTKRRGRRDRGRRIRRRGRTDKKIRIKRRFVCWLVA